MNRGFALGGAPPCRAVFLEGWGLLSRPRAIKPAVRFAVPPLAAQVITRKGGKPRKGLFNAHNSVLGGGIVQQGLNVWLGVGFQSFLLQATFFERISFNSIF